MGMKFVRMGMKFVRMGMKSVKMGIPTIWPSQPCGSVRAVTASWLPTGIKSSYQSENAGRLNYTVLRPLTGNPQTA